MNIYHHHAIHLCTSCSCSAGQHTHRTAQSEAETSSATRPSFLGALASAAQLATALLLLRKNTVQESAGLDEDAVPQPTPTTQATVSPVVALFSHAECGEQATSTDGNPTPEEAKPPLSPIAAAFLAALRRDAASA